MVRIMPAPHRKSNQAARSRLSAENWEVAALDLIAEDGFSSVNVERLARRLNVTKGSFYWHFGSRDELLTAALKRWEDEDIATFVRSIEIITNPDERLRALFRRTLDKLKSHWIFSALFAESGHALVRPVMERVANRRMSYLTDGFISLGMSQADAVHRARITYYSYVGFMQSTRYFKTARLKDQAELDEYVNHVIETLIP